MKGINMFNLKLIAVLISFVLLSGCAWNRINDVQDAAINKGKSIDSLLETTNHDRPVAEFHNEQWVNTVPLAKPKYDLPDNIISCQIVYKTVTPQDIYQFSQDITDQCRVRTRVSPDASNFLSSNSSQSGGTPTQRLSAVPDPIPASSPTSSSTMIPLSSLGAYTGGGGNAGQESRRISDVSYSGNVAGLLDVVTARLGISWKYENGMILFFYTETKRFDIDPADAEYHLTSKINSGISTTSGADSSGGSGGGSGGGQGGGVSGQGGSTTTSDAKMGNNLYSDLQKTIESMLTPNVGRLSMNQTTGTVMVTDVPEAVRGIGEYINSENGSLAKQVMFKVVVYTYTSTKSDMGSLDWNVIFKSLSGQYGITLANTFSGASSDAVAGGGSVLDTATGRAGQFAGSSFLFKALSEQVDVSDVKTQTLMTTNMAAVSLLVGQQVTYLKSVTSTPMTSGNEVVTSETLTPGSVTTGTNITILPKVLKDSDKILLNMFMDISSLKQLRKISSKDNSIEAPDLNTNATPLRTWMKAGQTLVLSGYEQDSNNATKQGVGSPDNLLLGGGRSGSKGKESFVVTVTPFIQ